MSDYADPFPGKPSTATNRDMDARETGMATSMVPTPPQPYLAHCCACNAAEIAAAHERQHAELTANHLRETALETRARYEQDRSDWQAVLHAAVESLEANVGEHKAAAEAFLAATFEAYTPEREGRDPMARLPASWKPWAPPGA